MDRVFCCSGTTKTAINAAITDPTLIGESLTFRTRKTYKVPELYNPEKPKD